MQAVQIIADSSIWIDFISKGDTELEDQLKRRRIFVHPMIIGEVALGSITNRLVFLQELKKLPNAQTVSHNEVIATIEWLELHNQGIGYVYVHLLASTRQLGNGKLWTRDKRLYAQADRSGLAYTPMSP
jgi:predicted nucleic acid-binding protein